MVTGTTRILPAKPGLDGHDRGIAIVTLALRDAGMEVIYLGLHQMPEEIVAAAIQEDVAFIGLSCHNDNHMLMCERIIALLKEKGLNIPLLLGGNIPEEDKPKLKEMGVVVIFDTGARLDDIAGFIRTATTASAKA